MLDWQPSCTIEDLVKRAAIIEKIRRFFSMRGVLEVETPALSISCVSDVHLSSFSTKLLGPAAPGGRTLYLQTSPEFHMKRLLAAGSGCIYSMSKAFRNEEAGRHHNPEFSMLEWYRVGLDHNQLMDEIDELMTLALGTLPAERISYQQAFIQHLKIDPLTATQQQLIEAAKPLGLADLVAAEDDKDTNLQALFCFGVETKIGLEVPCFIYDFPSSQAALAKISKEDSRVAERFELYFKGMELANGYHELTDFAEQTRRFEADQQQRQIRGLPLAQIDQRLLAAIEAGMPECAGVALGLDRLLMLALNKTDIAEVISFAYQRA